MTVSGQRACVENVAAPGPAGGLRGVTGVAATMPLPDGWRSFRSRPCASLRGRWYATAPYDAFKINMRLGRWCLEQTVHADTWQALHEVVAAQVEQYRLIVGPAW